MRQRLPAERIHKPTRGASMPYRIRRFTDAQLSELLQQFRTAVRRTFPNDAGLADEIEQQLIKNGKAELTADTQKKLARWCRTEGSPYQDAMPVAQQISRMLYGEVIDREVLRT
jgi:hypothetical protein